MLSCWGLMLNRFTYYILIILVIFSIPKVALADGLAVSYEQQLVDQDTSLEALLDSIYLTNRVDLKEAKRLSNMAFVQLQKNPDKKLQARLLNLVAYRKIISLLFNDALRDVLESRRLAIEVGNLKEEAASYRLEGIISTLVGDHSEGVTLLFHALSLQKTLPMNTTYHTLQNISMTYYEIGDYDNFLKYGYILLEHIDSIEGSVKQGFAYDAIGVALTELGDYSKAKEMLEKAEEIFKVHNSLFIPTVIFSIADLEYRLGNHQQALSIVNESISLASERNYLVSHNDSLSLKAKIQTKMGNTTEALKTLEELIGFAVTKKNPKAEQDAYEQFAQIYESQGKYQAALESHQKFKEITDELFNDRSATKIALAQTRFEMEQKEQRIALLETEAALDISQHTQMEKTTTLRGYIIVLVILMLFGSVVVVFRIILTRRILEKNSENLKEAYRQAEDANTSKSTFLASMSHDLRTPLNAILGYSEAIQLEIKGPLNNDSYQGYISSINKSGKLLLELIDDVLDLSKVEAGKYTLSESKIYLPDVISRTLDMISPLVLSKEIKIECNFMDGLPLLLVDERLLVQILNNLISNSLKFTDVKGNIVIECLHTADGSMSISISDDGIGMTESELQRALRPFEQIDPEVSQSNKGTGLGLTLCVKYMELHGGQLTVTSEKNVGTTTILHFPAERMVK